MQFQLRTLLLFFIVIWSSMAAFGPWGIPVTIVVAGVMAALRVDHARGRLACGEVVAIIVISLVVIALPLAAFLIVGQMFAASSPISASPRPVCQNNLKQIARALRMYHDRFGRFPPAYIADADGKPMHSWRVLILPYLEYQALYNQYDFTEPWDGPNNRKLAATVPVMYQCPSVMNDGTTTNYVAVTGPGTAWPGDKSTTLADFRDGEANTILLVESPASDIHWMEPRDLSLEEALATGPESWQEAVAHESETGYFVVRRWRGKNVAMADCSVWHLNNPAGGNGKALFTIADGTDPVEFDPEQLGPETFIHWQHCVGLTVYILSMILLLTRPLPEKWIKRNRGE